MKRGIAIADPHCGSLVGMTPPGWQVKRPSKSTTKRSKWSVIQSETWDSYLYILKTYGPFDFGFSNGDMIDGPGGRSGGTEQITTDREEQADMAIEVHDQVRRYARKGFEWVGTFGTSYHTGEQEDWESIIAERAGFKKIGSHEWISVNGCIFDMKHHCASSSIPHGRFTATAKERMWNVLWHERDLVPKASVILRAHDHYFNYCGGAGWLAVAQPALQGMGSKFGARRCSGTVDWGVVIFDVADDGSFDWNAHIVQINSQKAKMVKI